MHLFLLLYFLSTGGCISVLEVHADSVRGEFVLALIDHHYLINQTSPLHIQHLFINIAIIIISIIFTIILGIVAPIRRLFSGGGGSLMPRVGFSPLS